MAAPVALGATLCGGSLYVLARRMPGIRRAIQTRGEVIRITLSLYAYVLPHMQQ